MPPRIAGFRSRADLDMARPTSVSYSVAPERGGCVPHWGGDAPRIRSHRDCEAVWRGWQRFHMQTRRWADIAYTAGYCQHGYVLAGRGFGVRTAANGTNDGNSRFLAFVWVGGAGMTPTTEAVDALEWLTAEARRIGAGWRVIPHQAFTGSACPGPDLIGHSTRLDGQPIDPERSWFDMASEADLERVVRRVVDARLTELGLLADGKARNVGRDLVALRESERAFAAVDDRVHMPHSESAVRKHADGKPIVPA